MTIPRFEIGQRIAYEPDAVCGVVLAARVCGERFPTVNYLVRWDDGEPTDWAPSEALTAATPQEADHE